MTPNTKKGILVNFDILNSKMIYIKFDVENIYVSINKQKK